MKWHHRRPPKMFFDANDYQTYQKFTISELLVEERCIMSQLRTTQDVAVKIYLKKDLETIQRVIREKQPSGAYKCTE